MVSGRSSNSIPKPAPLLPEAVGAGAVAVAATALTHHCLAGGGNINEMNKWQHIFFRQIARFHEQHQPGQNLNFLSPILLLRQCP